LSIVAELTKEVYKVYKERPGLRNTQGARVQFTTTRTLT